MTGANGRQCELIGMCKYKIVVSLAPTVGRGVIGVCDKLSGSRESCNGTLKETAFSISITLSGARFRCHDQVTTYHHFWHNGAGDWP